MPRVGQPERATQNRVIALFRDELKYRDLGDWTDRAGNSSIEEGLLTAWLTKCGYTAAQIGRALDALHREAGNHGRNLYGNNQAVYSRLRYGVPVKTEAGKVTETVHLIDWKEPERNDFAIAEEVTLRGNHERRPDLVLYVNGIAVGVIELTNSRVSIGDGIRQLLSNQQPDFNEWFFSTVQIVFAGNDSEGLQYGTIGTPEKYFLKWKEDEQDNKGYKLDKYLHKLCNKQRLTGRAAAASCRYRIHRRAAGLGGLALPVDSPVQGLQRPGGAHAAHRASVQTQIAAGRPRTGGRSAESRVSCRAARGGPG